MIEIEEIINNGADDKSISKSAYKDYYRPPVVNKVEAVIYDFVYKHYGYSEASNPSWDIPQLANTINTALADENYKQEHTVLYEKQYALED